MSDSPALTLSVVIPVYNERDAALEILDMALEDARSTNGTRGISRRTPQRPKARGVHHERGQGKGAAPRTKFAPAQRLRLGPVEP